MQTVAVVVFAFATLVAEASVLKSNTRLFERSKSVPTGALLQNPGGDCHPKCNWSCGTAECDQTCDPVCAPPQCEVACKAVTLASCTQECDPPKCAVVCPTQHCAHGGCPGCKTVCTPPKCHTKCGQDCESKCAEPQCTWKCNPGKCEKPLCTLNCAGAKVCGLDGNLNAPPPPFAPGMTVLSKALGSVDPYSLNAFTANTPGGAKAMPKDGKPETQKSPKKIR